MCLFISLRFFITELQNGHPTWYLPSFIGSFCKRIKIEILLHQFILHIFKFNCDVKQYVCSNFLHYLMHKYNNYNKRVFRQYVFGYEFACVALFQIFFDKVDTCNLFGPYKLVHSVISTNNNVKLAKFIWKSHCDAYWQHVFSNFL